MKHKYSFVLLSIFFISFLFTCSLYTNLFSGDALRNVNQGHELNNPMKGDLKIRRDVAHHLYLKLNSKDKDRKLVESELINYVRANWSLEQVTLLNLYTEDQQSTAFEEKVNQVRKSRNDTTNFHNQDFRFSDYKSLSVEGVDNEKLLEIAIGLESTDLVMYCDLVPDEEVAPPVDVPPTTYTFNQNYLGRNPGVNAKFLWDLGITGQDVTVGDIEYNVNLNHEEWAGENKVVLADGLIPLNNSYEDHGTAVAGVVVAPDNGYGVTGIAHGIERFVFFSEVSRGSLGRAYLIQKAITQLKESDILIYEMQTWGAQGDYGPAEYSKTVWDATRAAVDAGLIVVAAAGNGNENLDAIEYTAYRNRGNSGAIIVGAGSANTYHNKLGFSTYGSRVDLQGWGEYVMTTGYSTYKFGNDHNQSYTTSFNGTSSATPIVASSIALVQSFAKNKLGKTMTSSEILELLRSTGHAQGSGGNIGPFPNLEAAIKKLTDNDSYGLVFKELKDSNGNELTELVKNEDLTIVFELTNYTNSSLRDLDFSLSINEELADEITLIKSNVSESRLSYYETKNIEFTFRLKDGFSETIPNEFKVSSTYGGKEITATKSFIANHINTKPVITAISDQVLNEGESLNLQVLATDSDFPKQNLTYSLDQSSENLGITISQTGLITWTTNEVHGGQNVTVTVSVTDGELSSNESFTLTINEVNNRPQITTISDQVLNEGQSLNLQVLATDSPKQNLTYSLDQSSESLGITISQTGLITWTTNETHGGQDVTVTVSVTDGELSANESFTLTINEGNNRPQITAIPNQLINEGQSLNLQVLATDSDFPKQNLTYSLDQSSENLGITISQTGLITWTTNENHGGQNVTVTVSVTDGELSSNESFTLTINEVNNRPQITTISDQVLNEGESLNLQVSATDSDLPKQNLTYSLDQSSENLGITISQTGLITFTTNETHGAQDFNVAVSVSDGELSSSESFTLTINEVNNRPQITTISDQVLNEGESLNLQVLATDSDFPKQNLTYSLDQASENLGITINQTGLITWTTNETHGGQTIEVTVSVTDGELSSNESFTLTINEGNNRPQITTISDQVLNEGESLNLQVLATDSDLPKQNLTYSLDQNSLNLGISINQNGLITWTTNETHGAQSFNVAVSVSDGELSSSESFNVQVNKLSKPNSKPVITAIPNQVLNEGESLNLQVSATDSDFPKQNLTYSLDQASENLGITINQTGLITWTTNEVHGGQNVTVTISVTDGELISNESFTLTINEVNNRPQITTISDQFLNEGESLNLQVSATDSDFPKQNLTYSLDQASENLGITINQTGLITWTTNEVHGGQNVTATVSVTDGELSSNESFTLTINEGNNRPQITAISDQVLNEGESLSLQVSATDSDFPKQNLTYSLDQSSENLGITISQTGLITWTTNETHGAQSFNVAVSVSDGELSSSESFNVQVNKLSKPNSKPVITAIPNQVLNEGESLNLQVLATDSDFPKQNLTYSLDQASENLGITINQTGLITWTTNETHGGQNVTATVSVTDGELISNESFTLTINEGNNRPQITAISDQVLNEGESLNLQVLATDSDFPKQNLTYSLDQASENLGITINQTGLITWTTNETHGAQSFNVAVSVSDGELSSSESFNVQVNKLSKPNSKPVITAIPNQVLNEGESLNLQVLATDSDFPKQNLTYSLDQSSENLGITINQTGLITWTTNETQGGQNVPVTVSVSDGELSSNESFTLTINEVNNRPQITAISDQSLNEGESLNLQVIATDSDFPKQNLTYSLDQSSENLGITISQRGLITWSTNETHGGQDFSVLVSVSDGHLSSSRNFRIEVKSKVLTPVQFIYDNDQFIESDLNNGSIDTELKIEVLSDLELTKVKLIEGIHFTTTDVPEGLSVSLEVMNGSLRLNLNGNALKHQKEETVKKLRIQILNGIMANPELVTLKDETHSFNIVFKNNVLNSLNSHVLKVYPNPVKDKLFIKTKEKVRSVKIFNVDGKVALLEQGNTINFVDFSHLDAGVYVAIIELSNGNVERLRLIKE